MMVLFVMLNFTSSGGLFRPELQNGFFGGLHAFWNGAGFVEGLRGLLYFGDQGLARSVWTLLAWLAAGLVLTAVAARHERVTGTAAVEPQSTRHAAAEAEEEVEETVGV
jgi:hypothetical protein